MSDELPEHWQLAHEHEEYDEIMDDTYRAAKYENESAGWSVFVHRIEQPKDHGGWGFEVYARHEPEAEEEQLGVADDFEAAKERAREFMREHAA